MCVLMLDIAMGWLLQVGPTLVKLEHRQRHVKTQRDPEQENDRNKKVGEWVTWARLTSTHFTFPSFPIAMVGVKV